MNTRGKCITAYRIYIARAAGGNAGEMSAEAEVGELLEAEQQSALGTIIEMMKTRWSG